VFSEKKDRKKKKGDEEKNGDANGSDENGDEPDDDHDDDDWCEDTDADAVARRMEELSMGAKGLMHTNDLEKSASDRLQIFLDFVNKKKDANPEGFDTPTQKEIVAESERLEVKEKAALALCEALFDQNILTQLKQHRMLLIRVSVSLIRCPLFSHLSLISFFVPVPE
jgi:translation initiation factor 5